jgi:hypothetical protein
MVNETRGGTLTLPDMPGFALDIAPGSVTFPDGSRSGLVSATLVHSDKIPMVPGFGQQPRFIVTIQPAGARFDPPARLTLPNVEGLAPGAVTEMYSFDHDLGHFVSIGPATVGDDGATIVATGRRGAHLSRSPGSKMDLRRRRAGERRHHRPHLRPDRGLPGPRRRSPARPALRRTGATP